ncbi:MAG: hypothetical protein IT306_27860 [Chloroflexi bacterium]|nr:hypothetical protein [Chloroflexota bacterium]
MRTSLVLGSRLQRARPTILWNRLLLATVLLLGALTGLVEGGTVAYFRGAATSTGSAFTAGTIDIANSPTSALLTFSDLVPGESVTAPLTVSNSGTLSLRYALAATVTNDDGKGLGAQLYLAVKSGVTTCTNAGFSGSGTSVYGGGGSSPLGAVGSSLDIVGTPSSFPNGGRTVAASAGEVLCFQVTLPAGTGSGFQGATTTASFSFTAQQL